MRMRIDRPDAYITTTEIEIIARTLPIADARVLELGCGRAWMTRRLATELGPARIVATEVDRVQHQHNLAIDDLPNVTFVFGGAEEIAQPGGSIDLVLMLKSLHHVPTSKMERAMQEIHRVLRPGGLAYISEPVYRGAFNDILRLFNDEQHVREAAFTAVRGAVERGVFELVEQIFFDSPTHYRDFAEFEERILRATHTEHRIDEALYREIRTAFLAQMTDQGADFLQPCRVDLLRKPNAPDRATH